jgi:predicted transposase YbfD/YdcC
MSISEKAFLPHSARRKPSASPIATATAIAQHLKHFFSDCPDPRVNRTRKHALVDIVVIAILAVIAGARGWEDIVLYAQAKHSWLQTFLDLSEGIPCADTFRRLFARLDPDAFEHRFRGFVQTLIDQMQAQVIALDGKTARGSYDRATRSPALQLVSAFATSSRLVLGQVKVRKKSNEITAIPDLLSTLDVRGCIITADALNTQTKIAKQIIDVGADYVLALKANHGNLYKQVCHRFAALEAEDTASKPDYRYHESCESGHHRIETRRLWSMSVSSLPEAGKLSEWSGVRSIVKVVRVRQMWNKTTRQAHYYLSSLPADSEKLATAIRQHWGVENRLHWVLDVTMGEDECRVRMGHAPQNLSLLRRLALNALNQEKSVRRSLRQKQNLAAMNDEYMLKVLEAFLAMGECTREPTYQ